jgi:hypothetical protein
VIPRKAEIESLVSLLEGGEYETSTDLAKVLLRESARLLSERDAYGVAIGLKTDDLRIFYGPFYGKSEALKVAGAARDRGLVAFVAPLVAPSRALSDEEVVTSCQCGHVKSQHAGKFGCCVMDKTRKEKCPCPVFTP